MIVDRHVTHGPARSAAAAASPVLAAGGFGTGEAAGQWHLSRLGGIETVWREFTGTGARVGIYDSGVQSTHWDLAANYDAALHVAIDGIVYDGDDRPWSGPHGTAVAGLIAAARNGFGTTGVAYGSSITSVNIFDRYSGEDFGPGVFIGARSAFMPAMAHGSVFDVVNHSWGLSDQIFDPANTRTTPGTFAHALSQTYALLAQTGRGGLGTVSVGASGNAGIDGQYDTTKTDRHLISVGAYRESDGMASSYSNRGASLLVSAPSDDDARLGGTGIVATDLTGRYGYNTFADPGGLQDHTDAFGGTSAAAPIVTGVVALMLDANAGLGWRDVGNILAHSATLPVAFDTGPTSVAGPGGRTVRLNESRFAIGAAGANANGGGLHYSTDYGYGAVNAFAAVRMAEVWSLFGAARTSANEVAASTGWVDVGLALTPGDPAVSSQQRLAWAHTGFIGEPASFSFDVAADVDIESLDLRLRLTNVPDDPEEGPISLLPDEFKLRLISPDGTEMFVDTTGSQGDQFMGSVMELTFGFQGYRGAQSRGTWTAQFESPRPFAELAVQSLQLDLYGGAPTADDVYHYTDEFLTMASIAGEGGRRHLSDPDGGQDWIDAAAVTADVSVSLIAGTQTRFGEATAFTLSRTSRIEHAVTGDGDDRLVGNALDNRLYGMRGDDVLLGAAGRDTLHGGAGDDRLDGGSGDDELSGGTGADRFVFDNRRSTGTDTIADFDDRDTILLSTPVAVAGGEGLVTLGAGGVLALAGGSRVTIRGATALQYDGTRLDDGVLHHAYSLPGSPAPAPAAAADALPVFQPRPSPADAPGAAPGAARAAGLGIAMGIGLPGPQRQLAADVASAGSAPGAGAPGAGEGAGQWHLGRIGDLASVWRDYTGTSVSVGIYDSGVQYAHRDLAANYDASRHIRLDGKTYDGDYRPASDPGGEHGTAVAGLIAAARNGEGMVGVAHGATITGVNIFDPWSGGGRDPGIYVNAPEPWLNMRAIAAQSAFDVANHSWGPTAPVYTVNGDRSLPVSYAAHLMAAFGQAAITGRGGLGTVTVTAAGNSATDVQGNPIATDRHVIAVAAFSQEHGYAASYSQRGAALLVSAPSSDRAEFGGSGIVTTDLVGRYGANLAAKPWADVDATDWFGGTSAAAPIVTGVVSLMLDANAGLGWRDVSAIIAQSATLPVAFGTGPVALVHPSLGLTTLNESRFAVVGAGGKSNGGGLHYSTDYGFGAVDAHAAVRMAEVWSLFGPARTSANERTVGSGLVTVDALIAGTPDPDDLHYGSRHRDFFGEPTSFTFQVRDDIAIEAADLRFRFDLYNDGFGAPTYQTLTLVRFKLISPDGVSMFVDTWDGGVNLYDPAVDGAQSFTFGFQGFRGARSAGTWTLQVELPNPDMKFALHDFALDLYGSAPSADDVHTYTDEFFTMLAIEGEGGRRELSDRNGGQDWVNAAAVTADVNLSLVEGVRSTFDNRTAFTVQRNSRIEHAVTGDGNDRLTGNALDNKLYAMRGNDWLNGGIGDDTLYGGQGGDVFAFDTLGVSGYDRILDWSTGDRIATSKQLRGADQNGQITVGSNAILLLDNSARGDTAELVEQGGAVLQAMGRSNGYWWYRFVSDGAEDYVDGRVRELALGQTGRPAADALAGAPAAAMTGVEATLQETAFFLYDTMGDTMAGGVQLYA